jgi:hypothetical protein
MLNLVDAGVVNTRRFCDLPLRIPLLDGLTDQAIALGKKCVCAADFVSYPSEAGQRIFACHSISSRLRCSPLVAIAPLVSTGSLLKEFGLPNWPGA